MSRFVLGGQSGASPLGFLCALGLLRLAQREDGSPRLSFLSDGSYHPVLEGISADIPTLVAADATSPCATRPWWLSYEKEEKKGVKRVADLKAPPEVFIRYLMTCVDRWCAGDAEGADYATAFGTSVAVDQAHGNTKPTAFHFTAANQQFLAIVESVRAQVTVDWARQSLFVAPSPQPGSNLRWDPGAERNWALMANNPNDDGTRVDAPVEWLAFRGLALLPSFPIGCRIATTSVSGRGDGLRMTWPLWSVPASHQTIRSLLQIEWAGRSREGPGRGIFAVCSSSIRRTGQGFGSFSPAVVES